MAYPIEAFGLSGLGGAFRSSGYEGRATAGGRTYTEWLTAEVTHDYYGNLYAFDHNRLSAEQAGNLTNSWTLTLTLASGYRWPTEAELDDTPAAFTAYTRREWIARWCRVNSDHQYWNSSRFTDIPSLVTRVSDRVLRIVGTPQVTGQTVGSNSISATAGYLLPLSDAWELVWDVGAGDWLDFSDREQFTQEWPYYHDRVFWHTFSAGQLSYSSATTVQVLQYPGTGSFPDNYVTLSTPSGFYRRVNTWDNVWAITYHAPYVITLSGDPTSTTIATIATGGFSEVNVPISTTTAAGAASQIADYLAGLSASGHGQLRFLTVEADGVDVRFTPTTAARPTIGWSGVDAGSLSGSVSIDTSTQVDDAKTWERTDTGNFRLLDLGDGDVLATMPWSHAFGYPYAGRFNGETVKAVDSNCAFGVRAEPVSDGTYLEHRTTSGVDVVVSATDYTNNGVAVERHSPLFFSNTA